MKKYTIPRIRLGGTSFLLHTGYIPAVRFAAERCEDVALLLMETGTCGEYLVSPGEIKEIGRICAGEGASLHVHLPTDGDFGTPEDAQAMVAKVRSVVERSAPLNPHTFVLHVDFPSLRGVLLNNPNPQDSLTREQIHWTREALQEIAACLPSPEKLAVENLETFPTALWDNWLHDSPYSRCLDIGHIWKDGGDPAPVLTQWLSRVRVIHLHGLEPRGEKTPRTSGSPHPLQIFGPNPRDHKSLQLMSPEHVDAVMHPLWQIGFAGVLTLEVFSFEDFTASHTVLLQSWERYIKK